MVNTSDVLARDYTRYPQGSRSYMGLECSGTIEKVGRKVKRWNDGDEVIILPPFHFIVIIGLKIWLVTFSLKHRGLLFSNE